MGISGFPIRAQVTGSFDGLVPWFQGSLSGTYTAVANDGGGFAIFTVNNSTGLEVGQGVWFQTNDNAPYAGTAGMITAINGNDVTTNLTFIGPTEAGIWKQLDNIAWDSDTPGDFLREIHVQFDTPKGLVVQVTLDGTNYMSLNNDETIFGLATFTMFVQADTLLNFEIQNGNESDQIISCVVTAA